MSDYPKWDPAAPVAPFDHRGLQDYPAPHRDGFEWRHVEPFDACLTLVDYERGRSAFRFIWRDEEGRRWSMFLSDGIDILRSADFAEGATRRLRWSVVKRGGQNYGIAPAPEAGS